MGASHLGFRDDAGDFIPDLELALFQPRDGQPVMRASVDQRIDRGIEIVMLDTERGNPGIGDLMGTANNVPKPMGTVCDWERKHNRILSERVSASLSTPTSPLFSLPVFRLDRLKTMVNEVLIIVLKRLMSSSSRVPVSRAGPP
jgi:hypothetical protein